MTDRKMDQAQILGGVLDDLIWVSNPCKFQRNRTIIVGDMVIFPFLVILTQKWVFDPRDPPGGPGSKKFCLVISLRVTKLLGPKLAQNSILVLTILIQFTDSGRVKSCLAISLLFIGRLCTL